MISLASLTFACLLAQSVETSPRLAVIKKAPDFQLMDQTGTNIQLSKLPEDVLLVGFIFTTCNGTCPATTHRMSQVQDSLQNRGFLKKGKVRLLSITLDPERDTPAALSRYMQLYGINGKHWSFLTGPPKEVRKTYTAWGMWAKPAANGQLDHPSRIFLVDQKRRIREIYNLSFMNREWVVEDILFLLGKK